MKKYKSQSGFAHLAILTIAITVALVGALGYIYWQNFLQSKKQVVADSKNSSSVQILSKEISETASGENLTLNYPTSWTTTNTTLPDATQVDINIVSPDNAVTVSMSTHMDGVGGTCGDEPNYLIKQATAYRLKDYPGFGLHAVIVHDDTNGYHYAARVSEDRSSTKILAGESACNIGIGVFMTADGAPAQVSITFNTIDSASKPSLESIQKAMATENFKTAIQIVQSLHSSVKI